MSDAPDVPADPAAAHPPDQGRGVRSIIVGSLLAVLAPLGGFLGGSMTGLSGPLDQFDPLFVWLFAGMVVGGIGAAIAIRGGLQWVRENYGTSS